MDLTYSSSSDDPRFQHLPNLWQVLHRKTQPPVCLFNFYLYMRDDEKSSEEVDFWLDVTAHEVLWRLYHHDLTRQYLDDTKETSDQILTVHNALRHPTASPPQQQQGQGQFLMAGQRVQHVRLPGAVPASWAHPSELETQYGNGTESGVSEGTSTATPRRAMTSGTGGVTKEDLQRSAERIYYKYLIPQAEKRVRIPGEVRQRVAMLMDSKMMLNQGGGSQPSLTVTNLGLVFAEAREIVFEGMESYYFPRFLKARAYGNMVPSHRLMRCVTGLFFLFVGFAIVLSLIFLNIRPRSLRAWALIPIFIGAFLCTTFQFNICPILVAMGVSETKWMQFAKVKEPYLIKLHRRRGIKVVVVAVLYTVCAGIIFGAVPGHRL
ncbi:regulator of G protein signaling [Linnemannia elongata AG-77]|uniref:Regulator of G protein signaling n=1 Tax=Linnemannia elongata AG-77 TaxID=1314771 RepID=A0A197JDP1_9FUNG|nr:regulator of G protein signaling [Linnemannia elongata AG-77]